MSSTSEVEMVLASVCDNARFLYRVASSAAYMTLALGYFLSVVQVRSLTAFNFWIRWYALVPRWIRDGAFRVIFSE